MKSIKSSKHTRLLERTNEIAIDAFTEAENMDQQQQYLEEENINFDYEWLLFFKGKGIFFFHECMKILKKIII